MNATLLILATMMLSGCSALVIDTEENGGGTVVQRSSAGMASYYYHRTDKDCTVGIVTARDVKGVVAITIDGADCTVTASTGALTGSESQKALLKPLGAAPDLLNKLLKVIP
jgi:uncharacterized protein YceK